MNFVLSSISMSALPLSKFLDPCLRLFPTFCLSGVKFLHTARELVTAITCSRHKTTTHLLQGTPYLIKIPKYVTHFHGSWAVQTHPRISYTETSSHFGSCFQVHPRIQDSDQGTQTWKSLQVTDPGFWSGGQTWKYKVQIQDSGQGARPENTRCRSRILVRGLVVSWCAAPKLVRQTNTTKTGSFALFIAFGPRIRIENLSLFPTQNFNQKLKCKTSLEVLVQFGTIEFCWKQF